MTSHRSSSSRRTARRALLCGLAAVSLAAPACGRGPAGSGDPALAAIHSRIPPLPAADIGVAPGFLGGGMLYVAFRPGKVQRWLQALPLAPDVVRDVARMGNELGFDPRVDDVGARLGLEPEGVVSMTLLRPLVTHAPAVRAALQRGDTLPNPFPGAGATPSDVAPGPFVTPRPQPIPPPTPPAPVAPPPDPFPATPQDVPTQPYDRLEPPVVPVAPITQPYVPPPPLPPKQTGSPELARQAGTLGFHSRVYVPVRDASLLINPLRRTLGRRAPAPEVAGVCSQIGATDLCVGDSEVLVVVRSAPGAVAFDIFNFESDTGSAADPERAAIILDAIKYAAISELPALATLRGDAVLYADADQVPALHEMVSVSAAVRRLQWSDPQSVRDKLEEAGALAQLRETRRLFMRVRLEITTEADTLQATMQWEPRDDAAKETLARIMSRTPAPAPVPSLAALCDGGLACMRTAGIPRLANFEELATGAYARSSRDFSEITRKVDEFGAITMFLETWPNMIGAAQRWPSEQGGRMEMTMIKQAVEAVGHIEGLGGSLRSLHAQRRNVSGDFIGYARLQGAELNLLRTALAFAEVRFSPVTLPQVPGKIDQATLPDADIPASLLLVTDPDKVKVGDQEMEVGWATVADSTDRLTWLLSQPRDEGVQPAFYMELPDLWRLFSAVPDAMEDLNFAQSWLSGRSARLAADIVDGRLRFDFQLARDPNAPTIALNPVPQQTPPIEPPPEPRPPPAT